VSRIAFPLSAFGQFILPSHRFPSLPFCKRRRYWSSTPPLRSSKGPLGTVVGNGSDRRAGLYLWLGPLAKTTPIHTRPSSVRQMLAEQASSDCVGRA